MLKWRIIILCASIIMLIAMFIMQISLVWFHPFVVTSLIIGIIVFFAGLASLFPVAQSVPKEPQVVTKDLKVGFSLRDTVAEQLDELTKEQKEKQNELFDVAKRRFGLDKQQFELEQKKRTIAWQKEALGLIRVSPQAAIIVAWLGMEQELQRTAKLLSLSDEEYQMVSSGETLETLLRSGHISDDICRTLTDMQKTRDQVAHARAEEVTDETAIEYVEQAIQMSDQLSAIQSPLVH
jgi:hypothetical protein